MANLTIGFDSTSFRNFFAYIVESNFLPSFLIAQFQSSFTHSKCVKVSGPWKLQIFCHLIRIWQNIYVTFGRFSCLVISIKQ